MAVFDYVAIAQDGKRTRGVITADSARAARKELRLQQLSPIEIKQNAKGEAAARSGGGKVSNNNLIVATRQLSILIQSGATVEEALRSIAQESDNDGVKRTFLAVRNAVQQGASLSDALAAHRRSFPDYYRSVIASAQGPDMGDVLDRLATHLEKSRKLRRKLLSAMIYPAVLSVVAMVVVVLLLIFVVPTVVEQFDTLDENLPPLTEFVIGVSEFFQNWWWATLIGVIAGWWLLGRVMQLKGVKSVVDRGVLRLPLLGGLFRTVNAARFARTFATLTGAGATVPEGLLAAERAVSNAKFKTGIRGVRRRIEEGAPLSGAMKETGLFPAMLVHMMASGERAGDLPNMAERSANYMEDELDNNATVALGLVEPLLIILLAVMVGVIVLAIMLPILTLNTAVIGA